MFINIKSDEILEYTFDSPDIEFIVFIFLEGC